MYQENLIKSGSNFTTPPLSRLEKSIYHRMVAEIDELFDPALEGTTKWEKFARLKVLIDPYSPLCDKIPLVLPGGKKWEVLVHYERVSKVYLYYAKVGHKVDECDDINNLMSQIKTYPTELHELLQEKLKPNYGGWINIDYLTLKDVVGFGEQRKKHVRRLGTSGPRSDIGWSGQSLNINESPLMKNLFVRTTTGLKRSNADISQLVGNNNISQ
jgi:hypothetical protein